MRFERIDDWLRWQAGLHHAGIDLGLERVGGVAARLGVARLPFPVVAVAGTNGKGSSIAILADLLEACGRRVGAYTSPMLLDFGECLTVRGAALREGDWLDAFDAVDRARAGETLTPFEFQTLAAGVALTAAGVDVALLEVGLGGALDAVNAFESDFVLYTALDVDHTDLLGTTREAIAREKAGLMSPGVAAVCADPRPPRALVEIAAARGVRLLRRGHDFDVEHSGPSWAFVAAGRRLEGLPAPGILGAHQVDNAAGALALLGLLEPAALAHAGLPAALAGVRLPGRQQVFEGAVTRVVDVAHNVQSARALAATLAGTPAAGRTHMVLGMLADKDLRGVAAALAGVVDAWHVADLDVERGASAAALVDALRAAGVAGPVTAHATPGAAWRRAVAAARRGDRIVACGSFHTARAALRVESCGG